MIFIIIIIDIGILDEQPINAIQTWAKQYPR